MSGPRLADLVGALEAAYPPELAEDWDAVGLVCGDPADEVTRVHLAVDATEAVVDDALADGAQALVVHHPLLLRGVHGVGADTAKGALLHRLVRGGCALFTAHTNADRADPGVSDALAAALGLRVLGPVEPEQLAWDKVAVTVPVGPDADRVRDAAHAAGAGQVGDYARVAFGVVGQGQFLPGPGTHPAVGTPGALEHVTEEKVEVVCPRGSTAAVVAAVVAAHPYEEVAYDVLALAPRPGPRGLGRVGELAEPEPLRAFTARVAAGLPSTVWGVRAAGDPERPVRTVAVSGGSGDSLLGRVGALGVDAFVTADLRHHPVDEHVRLGGPALVDVAHWASEQPWCAQAARVVEAALGGTVVTRVSPRRTDPWTVGAGADHGR
ncbi:Nif3-like dinuclear metal center hexameric protein [Rhodococcus aerolatus]